jgi:hypothetical protein
MASSQRGLFWNHDRGIGALVDAGPAIRAVRFVDDCDIIDLDSSRWARILADPATDTILCLHFSNHLLDLWAGKSVSI